MPVYLEQGFSNWDQGFNGIQEKLREKWRKNVKIIISTAKKKDEECKLCILRNKACFTFIKYYMEHTIQCLLLWNRICIITF